MLTDDIRKMKLAFLENDSIWLRRDEALLRDLWVTICRGSEGYLSPEEALETLIGDDITDEAQILYTIGDRSYWQDVPFSDDREMRNAVAAFNCLRGRVDLVYQDQEEYTRRNAIKEMEGD